MNEQFVRNIINRYSPEYRSDPRSSNLKLILFKQSVTSPLVNSNFNFERLEFLGDSIYTLINVEYILDRFENETDGYITKLRIRLEKTLPMTELALKIKLDNCVIGSLDEKDILENVFEAFIGAIYINIGLKFTRPFIVNLTEDIKDFSEIIKHDDNYKNLILIYYHYKKWSHPTYTSKIIDGLYVSKLYGADGNKVVCTGKGPTKREAEQVASKKALEKFGLIVDGNINYEWFHKSKKIKESPMEKKTGSHRYNENNILISKKQIKELMKYYDVNMVGKIIDSAVLKNIRRALTHKSYIVTKNKEEIPKNVVKFQKEDNTKLKKMGVAVIHFVLAEKLYNDYPDKDEGFMSKIRSRIENKDNLTFLSVKIGLNKYVLMKNFLEEIHGRNNVNIIGGAFQAFIGALYKSLGMMVAKRFFINSVNKELNMKDLITIESNYKDLIKMLFHKNNWGEPIYKVINIKGPDHAKIFKIGLYNGNKLLATGSGSSKKRAEQKASKIVCSKYN
jgi:dsRNA-specific ribonuclease